MDSSTVLGPASPSKILNSFEMFAACTLRLFADGLPRDARSKFIIPSLRFNGLTAAYEPKVPLRRFSIRDSDGRGAGGASAPDGEVVEQLLPLALLSGWTFIPGVAGEFSTPGVVKIGCTGFEFPWSADMLRACLTGLLGEVRTRRITGLVILALGGYGTANGDWCEELGNSTKLPCEDRREGERGEETYGVDFDGEWFRVARSEKLELLEGERDSDRRSCRIAELASTW
jgi:hypothetical protein